MDDRGAAALALRHAVAEGVFPGAAAEAGVAEAALWRTEVGRLTYDPASPLVTRETIYDLASLTKVVATTTLAMRLVHAGRLQLESRIASWLPGWRGADRESVAVQDLLAHCSGLPAHLPLYETCSGRDEYERAICRLPLEYRPGTAAIYSDLGFILLGFILEDAGGAGLAAQFDALLVDDTRRDPPPSSLVGTAGSGVPASEEMRDLRFGVRPEGLARTAPAREDGWRGRLLVGEVDDNNAFALGGAAGHAGMFGTVADVGAFARRILAGLRGAEARWPAGAATLLRFVRRVGTPGSSRALGWDTMLPASSCGGRMSARAFGHTGFTGTSLWVDPEAGLYAVLLSNRVHPVAGDASRIMAVRRAFHDALWGGQGRSSAAG